LIWKDHRHASHPSAAIWARPPFIWLHWENAAKFSLATKFSRAQLLAYTANLRSLRVGLEACAGAHFMAAALRKQGHEVRLIPAQFVKPYRKSNKNDFIDGEAIAEAVTKQNMRFVPIKTQEQLDVEDMHRVRDRRLRWLLDRLWQEWKQTEFELKTVTDEIARISNEDERCQRLR
jgi:transposase